MLPGIAGIIAGLSASGITFVGSKVQVIATNAATSLAISLTDLVDDGGNTAVLAAGDYVLLSFNGRSGTDQNLSTTGWTELADLYGDAASGPDTNLGVYKKIMGGTPDTSATINDPVDVGDDTVTVFAFRGVHQTTPEDVAVVTATGAGTAQPNAPAATPLTAGAWIITVLASTTSGTSAAYTKPSDLSSLTNYWRSSNGTETMIGTGIKTDWASGAFDPAAVTVGGATSGAWAAATIVLRPA